MGWRRWRRRRTWPSRWEQCAPTKSVSPARVRPTTGCRTGGKWAPNVRAAANSGATSPRENEKSCTATAGRSAACSAGGSARQAARCQQSSVAPPEPGGGTWRAERKEACAAATLKLESECHIPCASHGRRVSRGRPPPAARHFGRLCAGGVVGAAGRQLGGVAMLTLADRYTICMSAGGSTALLFGS